MVIFVRGTNENSIGKVIIFYVGFNLIWCVIMHDSLE